MPALCDNVLLEVFANLNLEQLYVVSQCSRRFEALAQSAFKSALDGRLVSPYKPHEKHFDRSRGMRYSIQRIFGPFAKHIVCSIDAHIWPVKWHYIDVQNLHSINVDITQMVELCYNTMVRFEQLERLDLSNYDETVPVRMGRSAIDFRERFPKLKTLILGYGLTMVASKRCFPRDLQWLEIHGYAFYPEYMDAFNFRHLLRLNASLRVLVLHELPILMNELIDLLVKCGTHLTLEKLVICDFEDYQLTNQLLMFERLKSLEVWDWSNLCTNKNLSMLKRMRHLQCLTITGYKFGKSITTDTFAAIVANIPPNIQEMSIGACYEIQNDSTVWTSFVAQVPAAFRANLDEKQHKITLQRI